MFFVILSATWIPSSLCSSHIGPIRPLDVRNDQAGLGACFLCAAHNAIVGARYSYSGLKNAQFSTVIL